MNLQIGVNIDDNGNLSAFVQQVQSAKTVRSGKGKSLLQFPESYVCIDLETTGLSPDYDDIIEMAAIRYVNSIETERFQSLVNPEYEIGSFITELTGITDEMLSNAPLLSAVLPQFLEFVGDSVVVGHNVSFDVNFIYDRSLDLLNVQFENDYIDTMRLSRRLHKDLPNHKLKTLVKHYNIAENIEHRALSDAVNTAKCFEYLREYVSDNNIDISKFKNYSDLRAKDITATVTEFDESHPIFGKVCVFTGVLEKMTRKEAMQLVVDLGGSCADNVNKKVDFLVLGNNDYCATIKDGKSNKQKKAEEIKLKGGNIEVISENVFYDMISD